MAPRLEIENNAYAKFGEGGGGANKEHYGTLWYFLEWIINSDEN